MKKKVIFNYVYDKNYSPENFTGILSSVSVDDSLLLNFYIERNALPIKETYELDDDGELDESSLVSFPDNNEAINLVRHIKAGLIVDLDGAKNLIELLREYVDIVGKSEENENND
jgi:alpha-D-ribose 1-methylphosphonate 5-triphosphate synthase subunit PhnI